MTEEQEGALASGLAPALPAAYAADRLGLAAPAVVLTFLVLRDRSGS